MEYPVQNVKRPVSYFAQSVADSRRPHDGQIEDSALPHSVVSKRQAEVGLMGGDLPVGGGWIEQAQNTDGGVETEAFRLVPAIGEITLQSVVDQTQGIGGIRAEIADASPQYLWHQDIIRRPQRIKDMLDNRSIDLLHRAVEALHCGAFLVNQKRRARRRRERRTTSSRSIWRDSATTAGKQRQHRQKNYGAAR